MCVHCAVSICSRYRPRLTRKVNIISILSHFLRVHEKAGTLGKNVMVGCTGRRSGCSEEANHNSLQSIRNSVLDIESRIRIDIYTSSFRQRKFITRIVQRKPFDIVAIGEANASTTPIDISTAKEKIPPLYIRFNFNKSFHLIFNSVCSLWHAGRKEKTSTVEWRTEKIKAGS